MFNIIDVHTHILPPYIPNWEKEFGYPGFIGLEDIPNEQTTDKRMMKGEKFFRRVQCNCFDHSERLQDADRTRVKMQVLSTVPVMFNYWAKSQDCLSTSKYLNDHIASICKEHPDRFIGLGTVPMQDIDLACQELERCVKELGMKGIEIGTHVNGKNLDHKDFYPFWKKVEDLQAIVFIHPWDMMGEDRLEKHWGSWLIGMPTETTTAIACMIFGGIYKRFPNLKVYYAHGGGSFIGTLARIQHGFNCRPDLYPEQCNPKEYLKYIVVDSLTHDPDMLKLIIKHIGINNVMVGSDYPFPLGELDPVGNVVDLLDGYQNIAECKEMIKYRNACRFFGIDQELFASTTKPQNAQSIDIESIIKDPVGYSRAIELIVLASVLQTLSQFYYSGQPQVDNVVYDKMVEVLKERDTTNDFFSKDRKIIC